MVLLDDAARERQPEAPAAGLGRESRFEDAFPVALGNALACVLHVDHNAPVVRRNPHVDGSVALQGVERVFHQVLHDPFEQCGVDVGLHGGDGQSVVVERHVAGNALAEIHDRFAHHFVDVRRGEGRLGADFRKTVHDLHQVREVLVHLLDGRLVHILRTQVFDPSQQRRGRGSQLVGGLLGQSDPDAVLLVVLRRAESNESQRDEGCDDEELHVGEVVERLEQRRLAVEDDVVMLRRPDELHRDRRVVDRKFVDLFPEPSGMVDDLLGDEVRVDDFEVLVGDDERDVVAVGHDVGHERVLDRAAQHVARHALHGVGPQRHVVLLLLLEPPGHVVGVEQRQGAERHPDDDHHHPVAEREEFSPDFHVFTCA